MTQAEVEAFQGRQLLVDGVLGPLTDWLGRPLRVDGDLGPKTRWALAISRLDPRRQAIVKRACQHVGQREQGVNRGDWIDALIRRCGLDPDVDGDGPSENGHPWCAAFASWCLSVQGLPARNEARAQVLGLALRPATVVTPGDLLWFATGKQSGHCGIVIGQGPGEVACVEGNHYNRCALVRRGTDQVSIVTPFPVEELPGIPPGLTLVPVQAAGTR